MACPYIDRGDKRCQDNLKIQNLDRAMGICCGKFTTCPVFQRIYSRESFSLKRLVLKTLNLL